MKISEEVKMFISSRESTGALLLTGKWGSGKTYLIRELAEILNKGKDIAVVFVSLFGIESIDELNRKVKECVFRIKFNKNTNVTSKKTVTQLRNIASIISEYSKIAKGVNAALSINLYDFISVENEIECFNNNQMVNKRLVIVFDDLERSKLDTVNLLGAINDYIENRGIKTILIADEDKISKDEYIDFKEKLIFRTIRLKPEYSILIGDIISNYCETSEGYSGFLKANKKIIDRIFYESELENIRSLKALIIDFERVYMKWMKINIGTENMVSVFYTFGATLLEHRAGNYNRSEYGYFFDDSKLKEKYSMFGEKTSQLLSLQNWITTGEWNDKKFEDEIKNNYKVTRLSEDKKFLSYNFWDLNNEIISKGLAIVLDKAYKGDLTCDALISLLQKIHAMNEFEVNIPLKPNYEKMIVGLDKRQTLIKEGKLTEPKRNKFIMDETLSRMEKDAKKLYRKIEKFGERLIAWKNRLEFIDYMENANIPRYNLKGKCIVYFDDELLNIFIRQYKAYGNYEKREIGLTLYNLYFFDQRFSDNNDILISKKSFIILKSELELFIDTEKDEISKAITCELIKLVDEMASKSEIGN